MKEICEIILRSPLYWFLIIFCIIISTICYFWGNKILGFIGEFWTKKELEKLPKSKYIVINDVLIRSKNSTHQIDHIVVSPYGIFSIETKQYNGYITGSRYDKYWVRHTSKGPINYTNPIRQNYGHVKALAEVLNIDEKKIFNVVCIPSTARLNIVHNGELVRNYTIEERILSYRNEILSNYELYAYLIKRYNIIDKQIRKQHIYNIRNTIVDNIQNKCPRCGGILVSRTSKYGEFKGCSNYPKCRYIQK